MGSKHKILDHKVFRDQTGFQIPIIFRKKSKKYFFTYLFKSIVQTKLSVQSLKKSIFGTIRGLILGHLALVVPEILAFEKRHVRAGSVRQSRLLLCWYIELSPLRSDRNNARQNEISISNKYF